MPKKPVSEMTQEDVLKRWPRLVAHMVCESLGYFTPRAAANAILCYKQDQPFFCEWYSHMAMCRNKDMFDDDEIRKIGKEVIRWSFERRHHHEGFMSDYQKARALIEAELQGNGPMLASWF